MNLPFISADAMKDYAVRTKVFALSVFLLAAMLIVAVVGIYSNDQAKQSLDEMYNRNLMSTQYLNDANNRLRKISVNVPYILQEGFTADNRKILVDDVLGNLDAIQNDMEELKKIDTSERAQETIAELEKNLNATKQKVGAINRMGTTPEDRVAIFDNLASLTVISSNMAVLTPDNVFQGKQIFEANNARYDRTVYSFAVIILIAVGFGILVSRRIADNISDPLAASIDHLSAVAAGDLSRSIPTELSERADEIGTVVKALCKMQSFMKQVHEEAEQTDAMVAELEEMLHGLNNDTQDMSAVTEEMSAGMEETAASTSSVRHLSGELRDGIKGAADAAYASEQYTHEVAQRAADLRMSMEQSRLNTRQIYRGPRWQRQSNLRRLSNKSIGSPSRSPISPSRRTSSRSTRASKRHAQVRQDTVLPWLRARSESSPRSRVGRRRRSMNSRGRSPAPYRHSRTAHTNSSPLSMRISAATTI